MKKLYAFFFKKKIVFVAILLLFVFCIALVLSFFKKTEFVIGEVYSNFVVIDAGHGGIDGGSIGTTGVLERDLNLEYAKTLSKLLNQFGVGVVMTRTNKNGLYDANAKNLKRSDMKKRKEIIDASQAVAVISIHMNSFSLKSCRGAQTFYNKTNLGGKKLATLIQNQFKRDLEYARSDSSVGDYYITNCTEIPAVIVECGFISCPQEEALLKTEEYKEKVCYAVLCGIIAFLEDKNI